MIGLCLQFGVDKASQSVRELITEGKEDWFTATAANELRAHIKNRIQLEIKKRTSKTVASPVAIAPVIARAAINTDGTFDWSMKVLCGLLKQPRQMAASIIFMPSRITLVIGSPPAMVKVYPDDIISMKVLAGHLNTS